jgi:hypothetical protein
LSFFSSGTLCFLLLFRSLSLSLSFLPHTIIPDYRSPAHTFRLSLSLSLSRLNIIFHQRESGGRRWRRLPLLPLPLPPPLPLPLPLPLSLWDRRSILPMFRISSTVRRDE